ncbi:glycosyltransferase [Paenibacillus alkaliterrae]|uniref:glycosyltransferase n=1 Tax=Paenibacillus alkaliterrae TaxID=320909 RepID=UPI001F3739E9|nr:glycosyltransferase [Paenibacillus alkaliterrae]MCF2939762.1 glycosyltransferase [Paenibacillus alkaliterrae]
MKVKVLTRYPWSIGYGGAEVQAQKYVDYALNKGIDISFMDHYSKSVDYDILHLVGSDYNTFQMINFAKSKNIKVVLSPVYYTTQLKAKMISVYLKLFKTKHHSSHNLMKYAMESADFLLPNSMIEQHQLIEVFGLKHKINSFKVIYNGVDDEDIESVNRDHFVNQYGINREYILCVSMIDRRKNTLKLVEAYLQSGSDSQLVIVGDIRDENNIYTDKFRKLVDGNKSKIKHIPLITDKSLLNSAYAAAKVHAMPSLFETPGLSNLEAASFGCNLVVGDCPPVREYFNDLPFYANPNSIDSIANAIINAEKEDRSQDARVIASRYYWHKVVDDLADIYRLVVNS